MGLALTRRDGEAIRIGNDIRITVFGKGAIKVYLEAPQHVRIMREELIEDDEQEEVQHG